MNRPWILARMGALLFVLVCSAPFATAAPAWLSWDDRGVVVLDSARAATPPTLDVVNGGLGGLDVTLTTTGVSVSSVSTPGGEFVALGWPDAPFFGALGAPALPVVRRLFIAPTDTDVSVSCAAGHAIAVHSTTLGQPLALLPVQPPIPKIPGALESAQFHYDAAAYGLDADLPLELAVVEELGIVRGQRLYMLEIRPVAYNAARQRVLVYPDIVVRIEFLGRGRIANELSALPGLRSIVLNPDLVPSPGLRGEGNYLVVVASAYQSAIAGFADAKANQGYTVATYPVASGTTKEQIKSYIQGLWGGPDAPAYILLVGDTDTIPNWTSSQPDNPANDLYYACMDGSSDWYPDIAIGRFPARNTSQLQAMVDKTLYYETGPLSDPNYLLRAVFMASADNWQVSEGTHNWVINNYMIPNGIASDKLYCHTYNATTQQVRDAFNNGRFFGIYSGHGSDTSWADGPPFSQSDVNNLTNQNMYAFVCSFACLTGNYPLNECFMETWVRAPNKAAVTAWGSSVTSYWTEDDILEKKLFDAIYDANDAVAAEAGPVINSAKLRYLAHFGSGGSTRRYFEMYNLMGDPALPFGGPQAPPHGLWTTPGTGLTSSGALGGPFTPPSVDYTLENKNETPLEYEVTKTVAWLTVTNAAGTIPPLESVVVSVTINALAGAMANGTYTDTLVITNLTDHEGDVTRPVSLTIGVPTPQQAFTLDANPGWSVEGQWAFGDPTGQGGGAHGYPDPQNGATGVNVFGVNLNGNYSTNLGGPYWLTSGPVDLSHASGTVLKFQRWLNTDYQPYVFATIEVSNDGTNWTQIWSNGYVAIADSAWAVRSYDIHAIADHQPTVYVRWGHSVNKGGAYAYSGWNIDDVEFWGTPDAPDYPAGDVNCDFAVDFGDINPFVLLLTDPLAWATAHPGCPLANGDLNGDGAADFGDINPFVALLTGK